VPEEGSTDKCAYINKRGGLGGSETTAAGSPTLELEIKVFKISKDLREKKSHWVLGSQSHAQNKEKRTPRSVGIPRAAGLTFAASSYKLRGWIGQARRFDGSKIAVELDYVPIETGRIKTKPSWQ